MDVQYKLTLEDHLAWYDYYLATPEGVRLKSKFRFVDRLRRRRFSRQLTSPANLLAIGDRTLELNEKGVREFSAQFDFTTAWPEIALVAVTHTRLFLAHGSMNAHIVPLCYFEIDAKRESFISFATNHTSLSKSRLNPA
jgi:hypothetical protein